MNQPTPNAPDMTGVPYGEQCSFKGFHVDQAMQDLGVDSAAVARMWGWSVPTTRRYLQYWRADGKPDYDQQNGQRKPALFDINIGQPFVLEGDFVLVGDVHAPTTDWELAMKVIDVGERWGIRRLIIGGDMLNNDAFSHHPKTSDDIPYKQEAEAAAALLESWLDYFEEIIWISGNHERRFEKWLRGAKNIHDLKASILPDSRIKTSRFGYCLIDTPQGRWRVTHPREYSRIRIRKANFLCNKFRTHIWSFHEHHLGMTWNESGHNVLINGGGLYESKVMEYVQLDDTTHPHMCKGFGVLRGGYPKLYGMPPFTNWEEELSLPRFGE
jgi:hypothetical protein